MQQSKVIRILLTLLCLISATTSVYSQITLTPGNGYIQQPTTIISHTIKTGGVSDPTAVNALSANNKVTAQQHIDGFGRPLEEILVAGTPTGFDLVGFHVYDNMGRESTKYLPYMATTTNGTYVDPVTAETNQDNFYQTLVSVNKVAKDKDASMSSAFETSPLQRLVNQGDFGNQFQLTSHYKTLIHRASLATDNVRKWDETGVSSGTYANYDLSVVERVDEDGQKIVSFVDKIGRTILKREVTFDPSEKWYDTYYIYDLAGRLIFGIPPKASLKMQTAGWNQSNVPKLIYSYKYDDRGRLTEKKLPGADPIYFVYDPLDRIALIQDGRLRPDKKWFYSKYDNRGRVIAEGVYTHGTIITQAAMQTHVNSQNYTTYYYETRITGSAPWYSNNVFPTSATDDLAYYYYDNYDLDNNGTADYSKANQGLTGEDNQTDLTNGMITGTRKRIIGTSTWLISVSFYNSRFLPIQVRTNNQLNTAVEDHITNVINFVGRVTESKEYKKVAAAVSVTVGRKLEYDKMNRLTRVKQTNNGGSEVIVGQYDYNPLGQLVDKKLHSSNGGLTFLQSVDLRYNIRGQLLSINNSELTNDAGSTNDETNDVFGMEYSYEVKALVTGSASIYTGQVSAVQWMSVSPANTDPRAYLFTYDKLKQLKTATYKAKTSGGHGTWTKDVNAFNESVTYDDGGNIATMQRNSLIAGAVTAIDNLTYTYYGTNDDDQLKNVAEASSTIYGFKNVTGSASTTTYSYDATGFLIGDLKKGITLEYNELAKIKKVTKSTNYTEYRYDASGNRISKWSYTGTLSKQEYVGGYVFDATTSTPVLKYFSMPEGRVRNDAGTLKYEYFITDLTGNVRVSFEENGPSGVILKQENSYYPFGMQFSNGYTPTNPNQNLYNAGSEWQDDLNSSMEYYSTDYREYDPMIGRMNGVDILGDMTLSRTTYHFGLNNPISFNDPSGAIVNGGDEWPPRGLRMGNDYWDIDEVGGGSNDLGAGRYERLDIFDDAWKMIDELMSGGNGGGIGLHSGYRGNQSGSTDNSPSSWLPFSKFELEVYAKTLGIGTTAQNLGDLMEQIFFDYMNPKVLAEFDFRRTNKRIKPNDNTIPDLVADAAYFRSKKSYLMGDIQIGPLNWVEAGNIFEVKATNKGLYLSSNDWQIMNHITNLVNRVAKDIARGFIPNVGLVTTWDVKWSEKISNFAWLNGVDYFHYRAQYRIVNGKYEFNFGGHNAAMGDRNFK